MTLTGIAVSTVEVDLSGAVRRAGPSPGTVGRASRKRALTVVVIPTVRFSTTRSSRELYSFPHAGFNHSIRLNSGAGPAVLRHVNHDGAAAGATIVGGSDRDSKGLIYFI